MLRRAHVEAGERHEKREHDLFEIAIGSRAAGGARTLALVLCVWGESINWRVVVVYEGRHCASSSTEYLYSYNSKYAPHPCAVARTRIIRV